MVTLAYWAQEDQAWARAQAGDSRRVTSPAKSARRLWFENVFGFVVGKKGPLSVPNKNFCA